MSKVRHVLGLSGGKDSSALAIFMKDRVPEMEYYFTDTGKELPEIYDYLAKLEAFLGKPIARLNSEHGFDHWLKVYGGLLPSSQMRWCTRMLKIKPFEDWIGDDTVISYVGIRADEDRGGYVSSNEKITAVYPFKEHGLIRSDIFRILEESGIGVPEYYSWRSRSGCYFCFFQRKAEWVGLKEKHPELFESAKAYEKTATEDASAYSWSQGETLEELELEDRVAEIKRKHEVALKKAKGKKSQALVELLDEALSWDGDDGCLACHL